MNSSTRYVSYMALFVLVPAVVGCSSSDSEPGPTGTTTAYVTCASGSTACPGAAECTTDAGVTECVALPTACAGAASCACLSATACGEETCTDGAAGAITCGPVGSDSCVPGATFPSDDGCNTCSCPPSGKKSEAACTAMGCVGPCDGKVCGDSCVPQSGTGGANMPIESAYCDAEGQCVTGSADLLNCEPNTCVPGETFPTPDGCNSCLCPASGKRDEGACTDKACPPGPCDGIPCGDSCSPCPPGQSCLVPVQMICNAAGECVNGALVEVTCDPTPASRARRSRRRTGATAAPAPSRARRASPAAPRWPAQ